MSKRVEPKTKGPQPLLKAAALCGLTSAESNDPKLHFLDALDECLQLAAAAGMAQLAQRFGFDLAGALSCYLEALAYFFERVLGAVLKPKPHLDDTFLARSKRAQNLRRVLLQVDADDGFRGRDGLTIFNEVAEVRIFLFADGRFERDGLLRDFEYLAHLGDGNVHTAGNLFA